MSSKELWEGPGGFLKLSAELILGLNDFESPSCNQESGGRESGAGSQETGVLALALPLPGCLVSSKLLHHSGPQCSHKAASLRGFFLSWHTTTAPKTGTFHLRCRTWGQTYQFLKKLNGLGDIGY